MDITRADSVSSLESFDDALTELNAEDTVEATVSLTDIEVPEPLNFQNYNYEKHLDILKYKSGSGYEGKTDANNLKSGSGTLYDKTREQHVQGSWSGDKLIRLETAQFKINDNTYVNIYVRNNLIVIDEYNFIARFSMGNIHLNCDSFLLAQQKLYKSITIEEIYHDELTKRLKPAREQFDAFLNELVAKSSLLSTARQDMFCIFRLQNEVTLLPKSEMNVFLLNKIITSNCASHELKTKVNDVLLSECKYWNRNKNIPRLRITEFSWKSVFEKHVENALASIKVVLISKLPSFAFNAKSDIHKLPPNQIFQIKLEDIQLFSDIEFTICQYTYPTEAMKNSFLHFFSTFVANIWTIFINNLRKNFLQDTENILALTKPVFLQLFKSFSELLMTVLTKTELDITKVITNDANAKLKVILKNDDLKTTIHKLKFFVRAMEHFKPGCLNTKKYSYDFKTFDSKDQNWLARNINRLRKYIDFSLNGIEDDYLIWLYYIHDCFGYMKEQNMFDGNSQDLIIFVNSLLEMCKSIIKNGSPSFERLRIFSESIVKFVTSLCQYFKTNPLDSELELLMQQSHYLSQFDDNIVNYSDLIASIIDTYQAYWEQRIQLKNELFKSYSIEPMLSVVQNVISSTTKVLTTSLNMKIYSEKFVVFLRSFNECLNYFRRTEFPWYVKKSSSTCIKEINKDQQSYVVTDIHKFIKESSSSTKHYIFEIVVSLMECIDHFLISNHWPANAKMQAASDLVLAMGRSFKNYSEQPNYEDFQMYFKASTEPFFRVTKNSLTVEDFRKRIELLDKFYAYTKNEIIMGLDKALDSCVTYASGINQTINYNFDQFKFKPIYEIYEKQFNDYIEQHLSEPKSLQVLAGEIKNQITAKKIDDWDETYKTTTIPKLLAGLSAVWSIGASRDVMGLTSGVKDKKKIEPHSIQIICILRLLGADQSGNCFDSHLAQVLTGQGKSVILALLSTILALTSNKVRVVCYNQYLANRDRDDFQSFFKLFGVEKDITYGTFEHMANEVMNPQINNKTYNIRRLMQELVCGTLPYSSESADLVAHYLHTILIIDEADVFFSPNYYGNTYNSCETIETKSFTSIQLKIWNMALNNATEDNIKASVSDYIDELSRRNDDDIFLNVYTKCGSFLKQNICTMVENAIQVKNGTSNDWFIRRYKLDNNGDLVYIKEDGQYTKNTYCEYYNIFNYLKLKKLDGSTPTPDIKGYLYLSCGSISYAILPKEYKKILGVTGTLTTLSSVEIKAVNLYNITRGSNMPSFFGRGKLENLGLKMVANEDYWIKEILDSIMNNVKNDRAVIVFFDREDQIYKVKSNFESHVDCVWILTGNEEKNQMEGLIDRAGVSRSVTLTTRRMGRGVDFKSNDSHVERKGGVHVIQTFFSVDIKEQIQIEGRTARNVNRGSYELIVCHLHVKNAGFDCELNATYNDLNTLRANKTLSSETELAKQIENSRKKHDLTMALIKSLCNDYDPIFRNQYFERYPFVALAE